MDRYQSEWKSSQKRGSRDCLLPSYTGASWLSLMCFASSSWSSRGPCGRTAQSVSATQTSHDHLPLRRWNEKDDDEEEGMTPRKHLARAAYLGGGGGGGGASHNLTMLGSLLMGIHPEIRYEGKINRTALTRSNKMQRNNQFLETKLQCTGQVRYWPD
jgi:hypothetical protein